MIYYRLRWYTTLVKAHRRSVGFYVMEELEDQLLDMKRKVRSEKRLFKHNFMIYVAKKMSDNTIEFWRYPTENEVYKRFYGYSKIDRKIDRKPAYLGRWNGEKLIKNKRLYTDFYYDAERCLMRCLRMLGLYEEF